MQIKKILITPLLLALPLLSASAQHLTVSTPVVDCGQVLFRSPVTATYTLRNRSSRPVKVKEILTSCNCTAADATGKTVDGGKEITVRAVYDAKQLGHFQKSVWVYEEGEDEPVELTIRGVVVAELKDFSGSYPCHLGTLSSDIDEIEFEDVERGMRPVAEMHIFNTSGETVEPVIMRLPDYLQAEVSPTRIAPEHGGVVTFTLLSERLRDYGLSQTSVYLGKFPGDKLAADKEVKLSAVLLPHFGQVSDEELRIAPQLQLSTDKVSMASMTGKPDKLKTEIILQNIGKSDLDISALQMFTVGMQVSLAKRHLAPGESTKLKLQINSSEVKNLRVRPRVLIITNCPGNPKTEIEIID